MLSFVLLHIVLNLFHLYTGILLLQDPSTITSFFVTIFLECKLFKLPKIYYERLGLRCH